MLLLSAAAGHLSALSAKSMLLLAAPAPDVVQTSGGTAQKWLLQWGTVILGGVLLVAVIRSKTAKAKSTALVGILILSFIKWPDFWFALLSKVLTALTNLVP